MPNRITWFPIWLAMVAILFSVYTWAYVYGGMGITDILVALFPSSSYIWITVARILTLVSFVITFLIALGLVIYIFITFITYFRARRKPQEISLKLKTIQEIKDDIQGLRNDYK